MDAVVGFFFAVLLFLFFLEYFFIPFIWPVILASIQIIALIGSVVSLIALLSGCFYGLFYSVKNYIFALKKNISFTNGNL